MEFRYDPDDAQAFHWERDSQGLVGHVTKFKIGEKDFTKDITLVNPLVTSGTNTMKVVGAVGMISWSGKPGGKMELEFVVSTANRRDLLILVHGGTSEDGNVADLDAATVTLGFVVYDYDPEAKKYFKAFHTGGTPITGTIDTGTGESALSAVKKEEKEAQKAYLKAQREDDEDQLDALRDAWDAKKNEVAAKEREYADQKQRGLVERTLVLTVATKPQEDPLSPQVWKITLTIVPPELDGSEENIHFAVASQQPMAKQWGFQKPTEDA